MSTYVIHYRDGRIEDVDQLVGTAVINGPNGEKGWHAHTASGDVFINRDDVLIIRDTRYPRGFDAIWDARREG